jgi:hypothetical protein
MSKYQKAKARARQQAIEFQLNYDTIVISYGGMALITNHFEKLAKRYGLVKEFRENGII